jgi:transposase
MLDGVDVALLDRGLPDGDGLKLIWPLREANPDARFLVMSATAEMRHPGDAIEAGTHSPWVSRVLEECGHEVLVANARKLRLIYANKRKTDEIDAENLARLARVDPKLLYPLKHRG